MVAFTRFFGRLSLDLLGFSASALCAVHCAALPLLLMTSASFLHHPAIEGGVLVISLVVGLASLIPSRRHHGRRTPLLIFGVGIALLLAGRIHASSLWQESALTVAGALSVALSHVVNWRHCHRRHGR